MQIAGNSSPDESHRGPTSYKYYVCSDIAANGDQDAGGKRNDEGELNWMRHVRRRLTVKLRGRTTTPDERRGRTLSPSARGAKQTTHHGPLQRLLAAAHYFSAVRKSVTSKLKKSSAAWDQATKPFAG